MRLRAGARLAAILGLTFGIASYAAADPIVYQNSSYIFGYATVLQDGIPVITGNSFDTSLSGPPQPTSGTWGSTDSRIVAERGATASIQSAVSGTITPAGFTGTGTVSERASAPVGSNVGAESWGRSIANLGFVLDRPSMFTYSGRYTASTDGIFGALAARLSPQEGPFTSELPAVFTDRFQFFPNSLSEQTAHAGVLEPGYYRLILANDPLYITAPGQTFRDSAFDFSFTVSPVPEPGSALLLALGAAAVAGGTAWQRLRCKGRALVSHR